MQIPSQTQIQNCFRAQVYACDINKSSSSSIKLSPFRNPLTAAAVPRPVIQPFRLSLTTTCTKWRPQSQMRKHLARGIPFVTAVLGIVLSPSEVSAAAAGLVAVNLFPHDCLVLPDGSLLCDCSGAAAAQH